MQRWAVSPFVSSVKNLQRQYVTAKVSYSKRYKILISKDIVNPISTAEKFISPMAKKKKFNYDLHANAKNPYMLELSVQNISSDEVADVHSDLLELSIHGMGVDKVADIYLPETHDVLQSNIKEKKGKNENSPTNSGAKMIYNDIVTYPRSAIPRRSTVDTGKWRLRNPFRLGIN